MSDPDLAVDIEQLRARLARIDQSLVALVYAIENVAEQVRAYPATGAPEGARLTDIRHVVTMIRQHHEPTSRDTADWNVPSRSQKRRS